MQADIAIKVLFLKKNHQITGKLARINGMFWSKWVYEKAKYISYQGKSAHSNMKPKEQHKEHTLQVKGISLFDLKKSN